MTTILRDDFNALPDGLPAPADDGAAAHLPGARLPALALPSTAGGPVDLSRLAGRTVVYAFPRNGRPDQPKLPGWDAIPGARGCTPESCAFRDHHAELAARGARVFGLSTQDVEWQREMVARLHLQFPVLSDDRLALAGALRLPTFEIEGLILLKRLTLVLRDGAVEHVFYPVFPPDAHAEAVVAWLADHPA